MNFTRALSVVSLSGAALLVGATSTMAAPIPNQPGNASTRDFYGHSAVAAPVTVPAAPQNPFMAANSWNNIHNDASMTDTYQGKGPMGRKPAVKSAVSTGECASITFNSKGQIVAVCIASNSYVTLMKPKSFKVLARTKMPKVQSSSSDGKSDYTDYAGGYFYLDNEDRPVVSTATLHLITYQRQGHKFVPVQDADLTSVITTGDSIQSALPDFAGNKWFITKQGVVGFVPLGSTTPVSTHLPAGEQIGNSFSMDGTGGVYIVSTKALYRFDAVNGQPSVTWREGYTNTGLQKPGQVSPGSGTTPTIMAGDEFVAIADNGDPESVTVYYTKKQPSNVQKYCAVPVFTEGASATENSLVAANNSLFIENNYGYTGAKATTAGRTTTPGLARVDVGTGGNCTLVWTNTKLSAPTVVPKFSAKAGLLYTYTKPARKDKKDPWYWTAIDFETGKRVYSAKVGSGVLYNNNYASLYIGPNGDGYLGVIGGIVRIYDTN